MAELKPNEGYEPRRAPGTSVDGAKLCPHCGKGDITSAIFRTNPRFVDPYEYTKITCVSCGASITGDDLEKAIEAWNTRSQSQELQRLREAAEKVAEFLGSDKLTTPDSLKKLLNSIENLKTILESGD